MPLIKVAIPQDNILVYFQLYGKNPRIHNKNGEYPKTCVESTLKKEKIIYSVMPTVDTIKEWEIMVIK